MTFKLYVLHRKDLLEERYLKMIFKVIFRIQIDNGMAKKGKHPNKISIQKQKKIVYKNKK